MSGALSSVPIGTDEFSALISVFDPKVARGGKIAIAVSGGADSMALAFCGQRWAKQHSIECRALIVDHGMRRGSDEEAAKVCASLQQLGVEAEILRWDHAPVTHQLHEQARAARYALLTQSCYRHGIADLMIAHHRDDQAETILMRLSKGSDVEGLAGMAMESERDDIRLLRPFLSLPKTRLVATCEASQIDFVTDLSNQSSKFARGRLRTALPLLEKEGLTVDNLLELGARAAETRDALTYYTNNFLSSAVTVEIGGSLRVDTEALSHAPRAIALRALYACLRYVHTDDYPPPRAALSALLTALIDRDTTRTLYGCLISIAGNAATVLREPAAATEILCFQPSTALLWDRRWIVSGQTDLDNLHLTVRALGHPPHELLDRLSPRLRRLVPQGRVRATLPALWEGDQMCAIPSFEAEASLRMAYRKQNFPSNRKML